MKKTFIALLPAILAHILLLAIAKLGLDHILWLAFAVLLFLIGGALTAKYVTDAIKSKNVDRSPILMMFIGLIVAILYVIIFMFTGCLFAVTQGA